MAKISEVYLITKTAICREDPDDSIFEIVGIFKNKSDAEKAMDAEIKHEEDEYNSAVENEGWDPDALPYFEFDLKTFQLK